MFTRTDGPFRIEIVTEPDDDLNRESAPEGDCYTPKQIKAFQDRDWQYVILHGRVMVDDVKIAENYLGGVEAGWYVVTDEDDNVTGEELIDPLAKIDEWYADFVAELIESARQALRILAVRSDALTAEETEAAARGLSHGWDAQNYANAYGTDEPIEDEAKRRALELYPDHSTARDSYACSFILGAKAYENDQYPDGSPIADD